MYNIATISSYKEIDLDTLPNPEEQRVLLLTDVDLTLIHVLARQIMSDLNARERFDFIKSMKGLKTDSGADPIEIAYSDEVNNYALVETGFEKFIKSLQDASYPVMGITSRRTGVASKNSTETAEDNLLRKLAALGFDFSSSSLCKDEGIVRLEKPLSVDVGTEYLHDYDSESGPLCKNGVVFSASKPRDSVLDAFFNAINCDIDCVVSIDDSQEKLQSMRTYCERNDIEFQGFHYRAIDKVAKEYPLDEAVVALQKEHLLKTDYFLTDKEAQKMLAEQEVVIEQTDDEIRSPSFGY